MYPLHGNPFILRVPDIPDIYSDHIFIHFKYYFNDEYGHMFKITIVNLSGIGLFDTAIS